MAAVKLLVGRCGFLAPCSLPGKAVGFQVVTSKTSLPYSFAKKVTSA